MSKLGPKCQYFVWPPLFSSTTLTLLGMEFTRAKVATGVLFHPSITTSQSWWMLETCAPPPSRLRMPHRLPLPSTSLARQWLSWRCVWGRYHVGILPCGLVSKGRRPFLLGRQPCRPIWCNVRCMVWALTGWPPSLQPLQQCWQHSYVYFPNTTLDMTLSMCTQLLWSTIGEACYVVEPFLLNLSTAVWSWPPCCSSVSGSWQSSYSLCIFM